MCAESQRTEGTTQAKGGREVEESRMLSRKENLKFKAVVYL